MHEARVHEVRVHEVRVHEARVHEVRVHEVRVHEARVHEVRVHEARVHEARVHEARVHVTCIKRTRVPGSAHLWQTLSLLLCAQRQSLLDMNKIGLLITNLPSSWCIYTNRGRAA